MISENLMRRFPLCFIGTDVVLHSEIEDPGGSMCQVVGLPNNSYKPITNTAWVRARDCKLQNGCTRLAAASDKVYQLLAHGRWFSPGTPVSSISKTGRHDIAEILLKASLNTKHQIKSFRNLTIQMYPQEKFKDTNDVIKSYKQKKCR